jgi:hypothetical protein
MELLGSYTELLHEVDEKQNTQKKKRKHKEAKLLLPLLSWYVW